MNKIKNDIIISRITFPNLFKILDEYYKDFKNKYIDNLKIAKQVATENLIKNIDLEIEIDAYIIKVNLELLPYWNALENGRSETKRSGDGALRRNLKDWIKGKRERGIEVVPKNMTDDQFIWATATKIHKFGFYNTDKNRNQHNGKHMLQKTINDINDKWIKRIQFAFETDAKNNIYKLIFLK